MAKKFLYFIAICIVLFLVGRIGYEMFQDELAEFALVPSSEFNPTKPLEANAYQDTALWYSRPGIGVTDPARWQPAMATSIMDSADGAEGADTANNANAAATQSVAGKAVTRPKAAADATAIDAVGDYAVFFVHPTSYLSRDNWNAPIGDDEAERIARLYVRGMASPFNSASEIWAPRYRQATMGSFLTDAPEAEQAIDAAYADVVEAYRYFLSSLDDSTPIVLAGHSQGSLHLLRLLREEVKGSPTAERLVGAYVIGWPISVDHDVPELGFAACATPAQTGCIVSWSSFAEPADPSRVIETYANSIGFDGNKRGTSQILCTNPLTGTYGGKAPASANLGTLVPDDMMSTGQLVPGAVPARCDERGLLLIGDPPELGSYVLPGNNYHVYDLPLFWANTQADVNRRVPAWEAAR
ncbi:DUF3089 domain-containing protein [Erythrobacter insulae]|uniref:DUF3089 domain-containing protein n=1 Tax=Erythrobacter insulae TaxID=2584124 RepID=A0A547P8S5_9SPHN|nr:DUF3089 domain-containing protein [Erythrobacter insulae]TRD10552.1 DUF3089 domain-containing protein [Erythrobacter insulae]